MTEIDEKISLGDYYKQKLDYPNRILFKREVIKQTGWSDKTFALRVKNDDCRPAETMMIDKIIETKSYLNPNV